MALMRRGEMHIGTPNKTAHQLVLREMGLNANALPYGWGKEVVRQVKLQCATRGLTRDWLIL